MSPWDSFFFISSHTFKANLLSVYQDICRSPFRSMSRWFQVLINASPSVYLPVFFSFHYYCIFPVSRFYSSSELKSETFIASVSISNVFFFYLTFQLISRRQYTKHVWMFSQLASQLSSPPRSYEIEFSWTFSVFYDCDSYSAMNQMHWKTW